MKKILHKTYLFFMDLIIDSLTANSKDEFSVNTLLLVRLDAIGDYILFRNFIEVLKNSDKYKKYKISLCGNFLWKDLAETYDNDYIDEFIWIDKKKFSFNFFYRFKILKEIRQKKYTIAVNPMYSRDFYSGDAIIKATGAKEKIGFNCDLNNITESQKKKSDKYYTKLFDLANIIIFEFNKNKFFFENLLNHQIEISKPYINTDKIKNIVKDKSENYIVFCPGSGVASRQWSAFNFAKISDFFSENYNYDIIIVGSSNETCIANEIILNSETKKIRDFTGKTTLVELTKIIAEAKLLLTNDTSTAHIAVSVNTKSIVVSNGNHFGRFVPYPEEIFSNMKCIFPEEIIKKLNDKNYLIEKYKFISNLDINTITVEDIKKVIIELLN
ncbi:glycosyltransferase family 9 protein [Candidatus Poribacteria bacterium]|nr:glycosyltransferase family 9 protein [Candidatus Poribacteria bacterium]